MSTLVKKLKFALNLFLTTAIGYTYADPAFLCDGEQTSCCVCQPKCGQGFITAEFLYWRPHLDGLDLCIPGNASDTVLPDGRIISIFRGKERDPKFEWNPGFRIGAGYSYGCNQWDIGAFWTHFNSKAHGSQFNNKSRWNIDLDVLDFVTGYQCCLNACWTLRPYVGIRGARIDQKLHQGGLPNFTVFSILDDNLIGINNKQKFEGIGPLFGLEADVSIGRGFSLYINGAVSWLYGRNRIQLIDSLATTDVIDYCHTDKKTNSILTATDASLGVRWATCFCSDKHFYLQLGFEHHNYYSYDRIGDHGDLSFDGIQLGAGVQF